MDINKIKPPAGYGKEFEISGETRLGSQPQSSFPATTAKVDHSAATRTLEAVAQFHKGQLSDPGQLESMIRACASELIDSGQKFTGPLSAADKQAVQNFLARDPCFRQQVESYLQKTLT